MNKPLAQVRYFEMYGTRQAKYDWLWTHSLADLMPTEDTSPADIETQGSAPVSALPLSPTVSPPLATFVFPPLDRAIYPDPVPVPAGVYQGLCRVLVEIEGMLGLAHCADASLAVQVAQWAQDEATTRWIAENPTAFSRGCGAGFSGVDL